MRPSNAPMIATTHTPTPSLNIARPTVRPAGVAHHVGRGRSWSMWMGDGRRIRRRGGGRSQGCSVLIAIENPTASTLGIA